MRTVTIPAKDQSEDIVSISHRDGHNVTLAIVDGEITNGAFKASQTAQQQVYRIQDTLYDQLILENPNLDKQGIWKYVDALRAGVKTSAPSPNYNFSPETGQWVEDVEKAKLAKYAEIEAERVMLDNANIVMPDGKVLQADAEAKANIQGKILEVQSAMALGRPVNNMVWRDADNAVHTWTEEIVYLNWLREVGVAIAERSTQLYMNSWGKKNDVDALTTFSEVEAYSA